MPGKLTARQFVADFSMSAAIAGFVTVLVGYTSSAVIVFQAARASGAGPAQVASWMWALGLGMGLTCIGLSLRYRVPVVTAWSTPGAALLVTSAAGLPLSAAIGAFLISGALMVLFGATGWFERQMARLPIHLASGMLAGVLLRFGLDVFTSMKSHAGMGLAMFAAYLLGRRFWPRYAVPAVLLLGIILAACLGRLHLAGLHLEWARPVFTRPTFTWQALVGVALPLFVVTMASQNVPGVTILRASGYGATPVSPLITWTGLATLILAPFGAFALNLAAITAALCTGPEAHHDPARRYVAAVTAGALYVALGLMGATVGALFIAFPSELVLTIAGVALFNAIGGGLATALGDESHREPALITFLITASGLSLLGIGSAFWGLVGGLAVVALLGDGRRLRVIRAKRA